MLSVVALLAAAATASEAASGTVSGTARGATVVAAPVAAWIAESNRYAQILSDITARYNPEAAAGLGIEGHDAEVIDLKPATQSRQAADFAAAAEQLAQLRAGATDARVRQDLAILSLSAQNSAHSADLDRTLMVPYFDLPQTIFAGYQKLLHEGVAQERQAQALRRLHRYVGAEAGYEPVAALARERLSESLTNPALVAPWSVEVQQSLDNERQYLDGIRDLFRASGLKGWQKDFATLSAQLAAYDHWIQGTLLPRARPTNRLPEAVYADNLKTFGVDADPRVLMQQALSAFAEIREEMATVAALVATQRGYPASRYGDVLRELKKETIPQDRLLAVYAERLARIETIVREQHLITLPTRAAQIRLGSAAESAAIPAPHVDLPRLIGNTGQRGAFVIPVAKPNAQPDEVLDDFSFDAITWTLTAHEARPGHELQFSVMLENGVSTARALYAFNSANAEGWALYAEAFMKPYFPLAGQLAGLQHRLLRAARAFLDPMVNLGLIEPARVRQVLMDEVCLSAAMAKQEVDRYTFEAPGQATAYFYGYQRLEAMRAKAEVALGSRFDVMSYHDFIVGQGLLPLQLLDQAVMETFVPGVH